jgi:hypothetical protein
MPRSCADERHLAHERPVEVGLLEHLEVSLRVGERVSGQDFEQHSHDLVFLSDEAVDWIEATANDESD